MTLTPLRLVDFLLKQMRSAWVRFAANPAREGSKFLHARRLICGAESCTGNGAALFIGVREFPQSLGLAGSLLIAHPNLHDPNFRRTVVYLATHEPNDGAFGFVINRVTEKSVGELLPDEELGPLSEVPVFIGGPVSADQLIFATLTWRDAAVACRTHLTIAEARELAEEDVETVRAFVGYSGWSAGQLEAELMQKAWLTQKPDRDLLEIEKCKELWPAIMREQGPWFRLLAAAPDDPSQN